MKWIKIHSIYTNKTLLLQFLLILGGFSKKETDAKNSKWQFGIYLFWFTFQALMVIGLGNYLYRNRHDISIIFKELLFVLGFTISLINSVYFQVHLKKFQHIMKRINELKDFDKSIEHKNPHRKVDDLMKTTTKFMFYFVFLAILILSISPLIYVLYKYITGTLNDEHWILPLPIMIFSTDQPAQVPYYQFEYMICIIACLGSLIFDVGMKLLYFQIGLDITACYKNVQLMFLRVDKNNPPPFAKNSNKKLFNFNNKLRNGTDDDDHDDGIFNDSNYLLEMKLVIKFYNIAIQCQNDFQQCFNEIIFLTSFQGLCILCFNLLQLSKMNTILELNDLMFSIITYIYGYVLLFIIMHIGHSLTNEGLNVADVVYRCQWAERTPKQRKFYLMIMQSAQQPRILRGLYFVNCTRETFLAIVKASFSILTIMRQLEE